MTEYNEDYYLRGTESRVSNYTNYRWRPELTIPFAEKLIQTMSLRPYCSVLDFGCARGYLVKALRRLAICAYGYDISEWAVDNCDPEVTHLVSNRIPNRRFDHVIAKDVLEHIPFIDLTDTINRIDLISFSSFFVIVPLAVETDGRYVRDEDEMDSTHRIRWTLEDWQDFIIENVDGDVYASYCIRGVKPAAEQINKSTGFILVKK